ncbi:MAG TPA: hypothetical protein VGH61_03580 [Steroidobacteraceae bacterium]
MTEPQVETVAHFTGAVICTRTPDGPLGLTLTGRTDRPGEVRLDFAGAAPADLPGHLEDAVIERAGPGRYRIASGTRSWTVAARSVYLHRDVAPDFYRAIPPRPAPLPRRLLFGAMLALARSRAGIALLKALRR